MSLTFGTIIADRDLQLVGLKSLMLGIFLSILFGFIFGLILGTTEMPWGYNDWPTDEMKGRYGEPIGPIGDRKTRFDRTIGLTCQLCFFSRGNYRSLWMGVLWALPSGTGVAVALLQGSNGPLIGVAISASLLPPVVNCVSTSDTAIISVFKARVVSLAYSLFAELVCSCLRNTGHQLLSDKPGNIRASWSTDTP